MKVTKEVLEVGRGSDGLYSDAQLRVFGFTKEDCEGWQEKVLGDEEPLWKIKLFQGMKDWVYIEKRNQSSVNPYSGVNEDTKVMFALGKSSNGGYNRWQLKVLGLEWSTTKKGWMKRLLRNEYSKEAREKFIFYKDAHIKK